MNLDEIIAKAEQLAKDSQESEGEAGERFELALAPAREQFLLLQDRLELLLGPSDGLIFSKDDSDAALVHSKDSELA